MPLLLDDFDDDDGDAAVEEDSDDNAVVSMMPKGREQVLSSTWGANKEDTLARNPLQSPRHQYY